MMQPIFIRDENGRIAEQLLFVGHSVAHTITDKGADRRPVTRFLDIDTLRKLGEECLLMADEWGAILDAQAQVKGAA